MPLSENIKNARKERKLTQEGLADEINLQLEIMKKNTSILHTTISNWENGISRPDADMIPLICKILKTDANKLLDIESEDNYLDPNQENLKEVDLLSKYKTLFDKDNKLTDNQKEFILNTIEEQHKKVDEEIEKGNVN